MDIIARRYLGLLCLLVAFCLKAQEDQPFSKNVIDLSGLDPDNNPTMVLDGSWDFYPNSLDVTGSKENRMDMQVPGGWPDGVKYGTYRITVKAPTNFQLGLSSPNIYGAFEIYINGELMASGGKPGASKALSQPQRRAILTHLNPVPSGLYHIEIRISNFRHSRTGITRSIVLGEYPVMNRKRDQVRAFDFFFAGTLVIAGIFFIGLFANSRKESMILYFALFTFGYAYRIIGWGTYGLHDIIDMPYQLGIRLEYGSFYLTGLFFTLYVREIFPRETPRMLANAFAIISFVWTLSVLLPVNILTRLNLPYVAFMILGIVMVLVIYIRAFINERVGARFSMYGTIFMFSVFVIKTLDYLMIIEEPLLLTMLGQLIFIGFQSLVLIRHFSENLRMETEKAENSKKALEQTQEQLIESEKMASIGVLTAGLAHELNNPLNFIGGVVEPLKNDLEKITRHISADNKSKIDPIVQEMHEILDGISLGSRRATGVIRNLLDMTPSGSKGEIEKVDLKKLLTSTFVLVEKGHPTIRFQSDITNDLWVEGNSIELNQVFLNMIVNSIDAVKEKKEARIEVSAHKEKDDVIVEIRDNGIGMKQSTMEHIFEPFFTSDKVGKGTGLGLYISQSIIKKHAGKIDVESEHGKGTVFRIILPSVKH